ncbi:hypothetical protein [Acerihabitans sp. TG2]|uniref:hypothetical protein n=1 Tax=Acerihabitans sp. TG2 TaxID=3096008 RepID=UPI003A598A6E
MITLNAKAQLTVVVIAKVAERKITIAMPLSSSVNPDVSVNVSPALLRKGTPVCCSWQRRE